MAPTGYIFHKPALVFGQFAAVAGTIYGLPGTAWETASELPVLSPFPVEFVFEFQDIFGTESTAGTGVPVHVLGLFLIWTWKLPMYPDICLLRIGYQFNIRMLRHSNHLGVPIQAAQSMVGKVLSSWVIFPPMEASRSTSTTWCPASAISRASHAGHSLLPGSLGDGDGGYRAVCSLIPCLLPSLPDLLPFGSCNLLMVYPGILFPDIYHFKHISVQALPTTALRKVFSCMQNRRQLLSVLIGAAYGILIALLI